MVVVLLLALFAVHLHAAVHLAVVVPSNYMLKHPKHCYASLWDPDVFVAPVAVAAADDCCDS